MSTKANLGCGTKHLPGYINVDCVDAVQPDVLHDLNTVPYPFQDSTFDEICAFDVVEHLNNIVQFIREVWRIGRPGAVLKLTTPHYSCSNSYTDPTHKHHLGYFSFDYFTSGHQWNYYGSTGFRTRHRQLLFTPGPLNRLVSFMANRFPDVYERSWAWIFPAWFLYVELDVCKG